MYYDIMTQCTDKDKNCIKQRRRHLKQIEGFKLNYETKHKITQQYQTNQIESYESYLQFNKERTTSRQASIVMFAKSGTQQWKMGNENKACASRYIVSIFACVLYIFRAKIA